MCTESTFPNGIASGKRKLIPYMNENNKEDEFFKINPLEAKLKYSIHTIKTINNISLGASKFSERFFPSHYLLWKISSYKYGDFFFKSAI